MSASLKSSIDTKSPDFQKNSSSAWSNSSPPIKNEEEKIRQGGGAKAIESQHKKTASPPANASPLLIDPGTHFFELGIYAAYEMYEEWGGAPAAGTITGLGRVSGRMFMIIANDATVKAGAFFPMTAKKVIRAQNIAIDNRIPTIYLVDSAGVFLPLQEDVFPDTDDFGRVFRNNAVMSAHGHSANHRHHGHVRRRRRLSPGHVRSHPHDRRLRPLPRWPRARTSRHRPENPPPKN